MEALKLQRFEALLPPIYEDLYRFIFSLVRNADQAGDALQETLLAAYRRFGTLRDEAAFKTWMFTIARRETLRLLRKSAREVPMAQADLEWAAAAEGSHGAGNAADVKMDTDARLPAGGIARESAVEEQVMARERQAWVIEAIRQLRPEMRQVMLLRYYRELSMVEIARCLRVPVNTVRSWHRRAREHIRDFLESKGMTDTEEGGT